MNVKELLEVLDIESPQEFQYFENLADLIEYDGALSPEVLYELFKGVDKNILSELLKQYFEEMLESVPGQDIELHTLLNAIGMSLSGFIAKGEEERDMVIFSDEFCRFRDWYGFESTARCRSVDDSRETVVPVREALLLSRMEKLNEGEYFYDFAECLDYPLEEYVMSFSDMATEEEEAPCGELADGFVYDDEFCDEID